MSWSKVLIKNGDLVSFAANELMNQFYEAWMHVDAPQDAEVFRGGNREGDHIYYFTPKASEVFGDRLNKFGGTMCPDKPDLKGYFKVTF